jgi:hypothetical protein
MLAKGANNVEFQFLLSSLIFNLSCLKVTKWWPELSPLDLLSRGYTIILKDLNKHAC